MDDMNSLLTRAATAHPLSPATPGLVDADLARGRQALHRRQLRRGGVRTALVALAAVGTVALLQPRTAAPAIPSTSQSSGETHTISGISLVAYTGTQPDGYTVDSVPDGWEIQGVNNYELVIAPKGAANQSVDSFADKLVVMLISKDASVPTTGPVVAVGSRTGRISHDDPTTAQLFFSDGAGHTLDVQVPPALHWSDQQIGQFGAAVHANATAVAGVG